MVRTVVLLPSSGDTSVTLPSLFSVTHSWSSGPQVTSHGFARPWASTRGSEPAESSEPSPPQLVETSRAMPTGTAIHRRSTHLSSHGQASSGGPGWLTASQAVGRACRHGTPNGAARTLG